MAACLKGVQGSGANPCRNAADRSLRDISNYRFTNSSGIAIRAKQKGFRAKNRLPPDGGSSFCSSCGEAGLLTPVIFMGFWHPSRTV